MTVSRADFNRFLGFKVGAAKPCNVCQHPGSLLVLIGTPVGAAPFTTDDPADLRIEFPEARADGNTIVGAHRFHAVACSNCGNTTFFHQSIVDEWLRANPAQGGLS